MKKTMLTVTVIFGLCAISADVHAQGEAAGGQGAPGGRAGKTHQAGAGLMKACADDIGKFCAGVEQGPKLGQCLQENESALAPACKESLKKRPSDKKGQGGRENRGGQGERGQGGPGGGQDDPAALLKKSCQADMDKFCKDVAEGPEQGQCLLKHEAELSAGCAQTFKSLPPPDQGNGPDQAGQQGKSSGKDGRGSKAGQSRTGKNDPGAAIMKSCKADAEKLCKGIAAGPEQGRCLKKHEAELSAECGKTLRSLPPPGQGKSGGKGGKGNKDAIATLMRACKADADIFCKDTAEGPELGRCLMERESELSAECGKTLRSLPPPEQDGGVDEGGQGDRGEGERGQRKGGRGGQGQRGPRGGGGPEGE